MTSHRDDGIVVVMSDERDATPSETYEETMLRLRRIVATQPPVPDLSDDAPADQRRVYWQLREIAARLSMQIAASRRERAETAYRLAGERAVFVREEAPRVTGRVGRIERQLAAINERLDRLDVTIKTLATKVELESLKDDIRIAVEGLAQVHIRLEQIERRLDTLDSRVERCELGLSVVSARIETLDGRVTALEGGRSAPSRPSA